MLPGGAKAVAHTLTPVTIRMLQDGAWCSENKSRPAADLLQIKWCRYVQMKCRNQFSDEMWFWIYLRSPKKFVIKKVFPRTRTRNNGCNIYLPICARFQKPLQRRGPREAPEWHEHGAWWVHTHEPQTERFHIHSTFVCCLASFDPFASRKINWTQFTLILSPDSSWEWFPKISPWISHTVISHESHWIQQLNS